MSDHNNAVSAGRSSGSPDCLAPLISVIIPTYGRADKIERALRSILLQDYPQIEVIVVDDNENPEKRQLTRERVEETLQGTRYSLVETSGKTGGGAARNLAAKSATGTFLAFLDDDDEYLEGKLSSQADFMSSRALDLSYQDVIWVRESGELVEYRRLDHARSFAAKELLRAHLRIPIAPTSIYMVRREYFLSTDGFGEVTVGQDWFMMLRSIEAGGKIAYMPGAYVRQYLHEGERLSTGEKKLEGEKSLYEYRKRYFPVLSINDRSYIRFRHFAVLAVASARSKFRLRAAVFGVLAVSVAPYSAVVEGTKLLRSARSSRVKRIVGAPSVVKRPSKYQGRKNESSK